MSKEKPVVYIDDPELDRDIARGVIKTKKPGLPKPKLVVVKP